MITLPARPTEEPSSPDYAETRLEARLRRGGLLVLSLSIPLLLAHAFVPIEEFVHRGDDAFYYFKVAANYPRLGFWSFDGVNATNGVQPLWAVLLTSLAVLLAWVGISEPDVLARVFVACAALLNFTSSIVLFHVLARQVSVGTAIIAAGAFLFPAGIVWSRVWGMENSLYALTLLASVAYFRLAFGPRATAGSAVALGVLLGLTALSRLNAVLLIPCMLLFFLWRGAGRGVDRLRLIAVASVAASLLVLPYFLLNYAATGHLLPISGTVKAIKLDQALAAKDIASPLSLEFLGLLGRQVLRPIEWFVTSRAVDALWAVGGRVVIDGKVSYLVLLALLCPFVLAPLALGRPGEWLAHLADRFRRLLPFAYLAAFGLLDATVSVLRYPFDIGYAGIRWWFVENEIVVVVAVATLVAAAVGYLGRRLLAPDARPRATMAVLLVLVAFHAQDMARFYWDGGKDNRDWNLSWNDEPYLAAQWLSNNLPANAVVGSWNAGVLGYYAHRPVVNLDGLINSFELLPYLKEDRILDYVRREGVVYLSDIDKQFREIGLKDQAEKQGIELKEVYRHYSRFMGQYYRIYKVEARGLNDESPRR